MRPHELREKWPDVEKKLQVGDVILVRARRQWLARMIQRKTHSYWNHAALVFIPPKDLPFSGPLIIEAIGYGIEIHQLKRYTDNFQRYDIAVKRFHGMNDEQRRVIVRNFMLENIDVPYDYSRIVGLYIKEAVLKHFSIDFFLKAAKYLVNEDAFVCSTFAHKAFMKFEKNAPQDKIKDEKKKQFIELEHKELYSPGDIAKNSSFHWIFNKRIH
ncbi:MAG: YiiX/YebB-like N1pC/P60 family cysteine hydrolase [Candidatus Kerfeldbacteria bacterium]